MSDVPKVYLMRAGKLGDDEEVGFNKAVLAESRQGHFSVRLWNSSDPVDAIYRTYERLPAEIQAELPLKHLWMLVPDEAES